VSVWTVFLPRLEVKRSVRKPNIVLKVVVSAGFTESLARAAPAVAGDGGANKMTAASAAIGGVNGTLNHHPVQRRHNQII